MRFAGRGEMMSKIATGIGILMLVIGGGALLLVCRELVLSVRFGGPDGSAVGAYNFSKMLVDGALTIVFCGLGLFLVRRHLPRVGKILIGVAIVLILLGLNAGRIS
jgi:hypothetical protein